jgi:hypothetical protein
LGTQSSFLNCNKDIQVPCLQQFPDWKNSLNCCLQTKAPKGTQTLDHWIQIVWQKRLWNNLLVPFWVVYFSCQCTTLGFFIQCEILILLIPVNVYIYPEYTLNQLYLKSKTVALNILGSNHKDIKNDEMATANCFLCEKWFTFLIVYPKIYLYS